MAVSQDSPGSQAPLPQTGAQSTSVLALQPEGQHPSELKLHCVMSLCTQDEVQVLGFPITKSLVQAMPSLQLAFDCGQLAGGSQVSPSSTTPLPQLGWQSV